MAAKIPKETILHPNVSPRRQQPSGLSKYNSPDEKAVTTQEFSATPQPMGSTTNLAQALID
jgi:hypothetical protein